MFIFRSTHEKIIRALQYQHDREIDHLKHSVSILRDELAKAKKNDTPKDAKTGRFVKK
jgi:hypothetical protein